MGTIERAWRAYERFLRIDPNAPRWEVVKARATYGIGWTFTLLQLMNQASMWHSYGEWTVFHLLSAISACLLVGTSFCLRYNKHPALYVGVYTLIMLGGVGGTAYPDHNGIDTGLLPFLAVGPFVMCFMGGWRGGPVLWVATTAMLVWMAHHAGHATPGFLTGLTLDQEQRFVQGVFAVTMACTVASIVSAAAQSALEELEVTTRRAQEAEAAKSDFLACMSHELRTPMNGVLGLTEVLLADRDEMLSDRQRTLLGTVAQTGTHLLSVVDDILDLSKLDAGKLTIEPRAFDPRALVHGVAATFEATAESKGIALTVRVDDAVPPRLVGDDQRLRQVLSNLVSNAIKFTEAGGVTLEAVPGAIPGHTALRVTDTGCGVPEDRQAAIFSAFEQAEGGTTRRFGGTGLGLAICRRLAELMGGAVTLERSGPAGSVFLLSLPLLPASSKVTPEAALPTIPASLDGLAVLVVEDNQVNRLVAGEMLRALGAQATFAQDGRQALDALRVSSFDVVLMDKHMPVMDGVEATRAIRASNERWAGVPIVALTADAMEGEEAAMLAAGMDAFATKPVRAEALSDAIGRAMSIRQEDRTAVA